MFINHFWPFIVLSMLATCNGLQQETPSIEPFPAIETMLKTDSYNTKAQQLSTKVMISTGRKKTEVIDFADSNVKCEDLEDFPMETQAAVGANLVSTPIICGGLFYNGSHHSSDVCFKYMKGGWQQFATMIERRTWAAGIVYDNALHIFGGYDQDTNTILQSSEIVKEDGNLTEGTQLPKPIYAHAIASINSTVSIITGGNSYSDKTWYFNHASQEFQPGPNLLEGRYHHSAGYVIDQETKEKMAIISGGYNIDISEGNVDIIYLDSTEMLMNGQWMTGKTHTESNTCSFLVPSARVGIKLS